MKTAVACFKRGLFGAAVLLCLTLALPASAQVSGYTEYCELRLEGCPQDYDKKELTVPLNVVALSSRVKACPRLDTAQYLGGGPPAVMFLIDHSMSMGGGSKNDDGTYSRPNDSLGNRFRVTRALVDTISIAYPDAKVGVTVFGKGLVLRSGWDQNLVLFDGYKYEDEAEEAFLPIHPLDATVRSVGLTGNGYAHGAGDTPTWLNVIQRMFDVPPKTGVVSTLRDGRGNKVEEENGTNISMAFEAAVQAFENISTPKQNRYIIFLSDGEPWIDPDKCKPGSPYCNQWYNRKYDFIKGENLPTTYTVFLTTDPDNPELYDTLEIMTENIRKNGYSESNPRSAIKAMTSDYTDLLKYMMESIVTPMLSNSSGSAKTIVVSSAGVKDSTGAMNGGFTFSRPLPMDTAEITNVNMGIRYDVVVDSTIKIESFGQYRDSVITRFVPDSLFNYSFTIRRSAATLGDDWLSEHDLATDCGTKSSLDLRFRGETLVGDNKAIKGNMDVLEIVFDNTDGLFGYDSVVVQVFNVDDEIADFENLTLTKNADGKWSCQFPRVANVAAVKGDGTLQHAEQDSVILFFRNPDVPLDTIRVAVPYISNTILFYDAPGDPEKGTRLNSYMELTAGATLDIYAKIFNSNGDWDEEMTANTDRIVWTISTTADTVDTAALMTKDGAHSVFGTTTAGRSYVVAATYTDGALRIKGQMTIKVVPGAPVYIETVTDSAGINFGREPNTAYLVGNKEFTFKKGTEHAVFYAVLRDAYGNFIGLADGADWKSTYEKSITVEEFDGGTAAVVSKHGSTFGDHLYVIVEKDGISDTVHITVVSESYSAVSPNPFVPGSSPIMSRLETLANGRPNTQLELYRLIVKHTKGGGGGNGNEYNANGVLVTATAPVPVKTKGGNGDVKLVTDAKAMIYDAVGRVVYRSGSGDIVTPDGSTFGFVWDGKSTNGKTVGPGTYAVQITAVMTNGEKFFVQRMIGVKLER